MVNLGPSKACLTCKRRRKKCDETRPSCLRCRNSKRTCRGYEQTTQNYQIRQYGSKQQRVHGSVLEKPIARKCSLPKRELLPGMSTLPPDVIPKEVEVEKADQCALQAFFHEYCIPSSNTGISPGFLRGLEQKFHDVAPDSMVKIACEAVAYASSGVSLNRPLLSHRAVVLYQGVLSRFAYSMHDLGLIEREDSLLVAMLLGLYEIIIENELHPGYHNAHARGVAALLGIQNSPRHLIEAVHRGHPALSRKGVKEHTEAIFTAPGSSRYARRLDDLLLSLGSLLKRSNAILEGSPAFFGETLYQLQNEALELDRAFQIWEQAREKSFHPSTVFHIDNNHIPSRCHVGFWPGKADTYFDLYTSAVWNIYRASRLFLIDLILRLSNALNDGRSPDAENAVAASLIDGMLASIPFHLVEDLYSFSREIHTTSSIKNPGRAVGGLLLMHSISITSHLGLVNFPAQEYLKRCLRWIAKNMGIGQASILAQASNIDFEYLSGSCMILLVGLLV